MGKSFLGRTTFLCLFPERVLSRYSLSDARSLARNPPRRLHTGVWTRIHVESITCFKLSSRANSSNHQPCRCYSMLDIQRLGSKGRNIPTLLQLFKKYSHALARASLSGTVRFKIEKKHEASFEFRRVKKGKVGSFFESRARNGVLKFAAGTCEARKLKFSEQINEFNVSARAWVFSWLQRLSPARNWNRPRFLGLLVTLSYLHCCFIVEPFVEPLNPSLGYSSAEWNFRRVRCFLCHDACFYIRCFSSLSGGSRWSRGTKGAVKDYSRTRPVFTNRGNSTRLHRRYTAHKCGSRTKRPLSRDACTRQITPYTTFSQSLFFRFVRFVYLSATKNQITSSTPPSLLQQSLSSDGFLPSRISVRCLYSTGSPDKSVKYEHLIVPFNQATYTRNRGRRSSRIWRIRRMLGTWYALRNGTRYVPRNRATRQPASYPRDSPVNHVRTWRYHREPELWKRKLQTRNAPRAFFCKIIS